ncbi:MAG: ATP synthase F1 subunit delta [Kofleriaceae bacterium]|nr:ATP synthase F1 subunit delta [Kofleriaceae bacterium]MCB9571701.1 ATP synthase F1 subunit delta [Kofleriaceae bacterium]
MVTGSLARRYARALLAIGADAKNADRLGGDVRNFAKALAASPELVTTLSNPAFPRADRKKIIDALATRFAVQPTSRNFLFVLLDHERFAHVPAISRELDRMLEAQAGRVEAEVVSATPLSPAQVTQITTVLEQLSGKKVTVVKREDPALLGGVVAKVGDLVYDGSLRSQLRALRDDMAK